MNILFKKVFGFRKSTEWIYVFALYLFLSLFKFWNLFFSNSSKTLATEGDGLGTISGIFAVSDAVNQYGIRVLFGDRFYDPMVGLGMQDPSWISTFWKVNWWFLSLFFKPDDVYDFNGVLSFVLICTLGFLLLRLFKVPFILSFIGGLFFVYLDHFSSRLGSHLTGLGAYYGALSFIYFGIYFCLKVNLKSSIYFALSSLFLFLTNEYFGYFGLIFGSIVFSLFLFMSYMNKAFLLKQVTLYVGVFSCVFLFLMVCFYPSIIGTNLLNLFSQRKMSRLNVGEHPWSDFGAYSLVNHRSLFRPDFQFLANFFPSSYFQNDVWEMSFRMGAILPFFTMLFLLIIFAFLVFFKKQQSLYQKKLGYFSLFSMVVFLLGAFVLILFSLSPKHKLSLVFLTYKYAPMFRVGTRALLYTNVAFIIAFFIGLSFLNQVSFFYLRKILKSRYYSLGITSALCTGILWLSFSDLASGGIFDRVQDFPTPVPKTYAAIQRSKFGVLLELPVNSPLERPPEANYPYAYHRIFHQKPVANFLYGNPPYSCSIIYFSKLFNIANDDDLLRIHKLGISYIAVSKTLAKKQYLVLLTNNTYKKLPIEDNDTALFKADVFSELSYDVIARNIKQLIEEKCNVATQ